VACEAFVRVLPCSNRCPAALGIRAPLDGPPGPRRCRTVAIKLMRTAASVENPRRAKTLCVRDFRWDTTREQILPRCAVRVPSGHVPSVFKDEPPRARTAQSSLDNDRPWHLDDWVRFASASNKKAAFAEKVEAAFMLRSPHVQRCHSCRLQVCGYGTWPCSSLFRAHSCRIQRPSSQPSPSPSTFLDPFPPPPPSAPSSDESPAERLEEHGRSARTVEFTVCSNVQWQEAQIAPMSSALAVASTAAAETRSDSGEQRSPTRTSRGGLRPATSERISRRAPFPVACSVKQSYGPSSTYTPFIRARGVAAAAAAARPTAAAVGRVRSESDGVAVTHEVWLIDHQRKMQEYVASAACGFHCADSHGVRGRLAFRGAL
jgi:hypothetical protein